MRRRFPMKRPLALSLAAVVGLNAEAVLAAAPARALPAKHAMVVSIQHDASDAGLEVLRQGGNAVDAAVAVGFALAVVFPQAGNLGGGGFMLVRDHTGEAHFLDFRERAPGAATADMYLDAEGKVVPGLSTRGYKAIGVPGSVAGLTYAQKHFGKLTLKRDMAPAIKLATEGYVLSEEEARGLHNKNVTAFAESARIFQRNGNFYNAGDTFKQPELARTLERIAENPDEFYHGAMAKQLAKDVKQHGGLLTEADLAAYRVADRKPLVGRYSVRGTDYEVGDVAAAELGRDCAAGDVEYPERGGPGKAGGGPERGAGALDRGGVSAGVYGSERLPGGSGLQRDAAKGDG